MNNVGARPGSFRENLKAVLFEKRLSHQDAAELTGYSRQSVSFWVEGKHEPPLKDIPGIAAALGVPAERLLIGNAERAQRLPDPGYIAGNVHRQVLRSVDDDLQAHLIEVGSRLRMFRETAEIEAEECCRAFRVALDLWQMWEQGRAWADPLVMIAFCDTYACTMDWLERGDLNSLSDKTRTAMRKRDQRTPEDLARGRKRRHMERAASVAHYAAAG